MLSWTCLGADALVRGGAAKSAPRTHRFPVQAAPRVDDAPAVSARAARSTVFDTLYLLLAFGHESAAAAARLDPPGATFRIRLVCVLLGACGGYFCKGGAARRLDRFLAFLQRYLLAKPPLPLDVEFDVQARRGGPPGAACQSSPTARPEALPCFSFAYSATCWPSRRCRWTSPST